MDRIEFEELALKNVDPSLGPELMRRGKPSMVLEERKKQRDLVSRLSCPTLWLIDDLTNPTLDTINTPNVFCIPDIAPTTSAYYAARESTDTQKGILLLDVRHSVDRPIEAYTYVSLLR